MQGYLADNRENVRQSVASTRDLIASLNDIMARDRAKVERMLDGMDAIASPRRPRALSGRPDRRPGVEHPGTQPCGDRAIGDERPRRHRLGEQAGPEDLHQPVCPESVLQANPRRLRVQAVYDTALVFTKGAQELHDTLKTIEIMAARPATPQQQQEIASAPAERPDADRTS